LITDLTKPEVRSFVASNEDADVKDLLLKYKVIHGVPASLIARQIKGRQKAKLKLPSFYNCENIIYPPSVNLEQSSSERAARHKVSFLKGLFPSKPETGFDLTGGLGVDCLYLSSVFNTFHYVEPDPELFEISRNNLLALNIRNVEFHRCTAGEFLDATSQKPHLVYIDPSRRTGGDRKEFSLSQCEPDITTLQERIFDITERLLVKTSPLLDIQQGLRELKFVKNVVVVAVDNECREVLFYGEKPFVGEPVITAINLAMNEDPALHFTLTEEKNMVAEFAEPQQFLYESNAAIMKAGAFKTAAKEFRVLKIHPNTHLYTSREKIADFPGRIFSVLSPVTSKPKEIAKHFPQKKANIVLRNYPLTIDEFKKKTGLKDGGEKYLVGFTGIKGKHLLVAERLK